MDQYIKVISLFKKMYLLLDKGLRRKIWLLFVVILISGFLESFSVSLLLPFVQGIMNIDSIRESNVYITINDWTNSMLERHFFLITSIVIILLFIFKNIFLVFSTYLQGKFTSKARKDISEKLFSSMLKYPYSFFVEENSSSMLRALTVDVEHFVGTLMSYVDLVLKCINVIFLMLLMAYSNIVLTLVVMCLAIIILVLLVTGLKEKMKLCGKRIRVANEKLIEVAKETINGIKEIKVLHCENYFTMQYSLEVDNRGKTDIQYKVLGVLPEKIIETLFISGMVVSILVMKNMLNENMLARLVIFGLAMVKILPYLTQISGCITNIIYYYPGAKDSVETIEYRMKVESEHIFKDVKRIEINNSLEFQNVSFGYNGRRVFDKMSIKINMGDAIAVVGPSGGGKTTFADLILGLRIIEDGKVFIDGEEVFLDENIWHGEIGLVSQNIFLLNDSIKNNIAFGKETSEIDLEKIKSTIDQANLTDFVESLEHGIDTYVGEHGGKLSGGQRQRISIARALYMEPKILILDEATSALDESTEKSVMDSINKLLGKVTLIIITHRMDTIKKCNRILEIKNGGIIEHTSLNEVNSNLWSNENK